VSATAAPTAFEVFAAERERVRRREEAAREALEAVIEQWPCCRDHVAARRGLDALAPLERCPQHAQIQGYRYTAPRGTSSGEAESG
jgi:hypothetical protein